MAGIDNNTVLYLRGDSFKDLSLNPKTVSNSGATIVDDGVFSKTLLLSSSNYINVEAGSSIDFGTGDFTLSCYVKPNDTSGTLFAYQWGNTATGYAWGVRIFSGKVRFMINTGSEKYIDSSSNVSTNSFTHVAITRESGVVKLFVNGKLESTVTYSGSLLVNSQKRVSIGKHSNNSVGGFDGSISDIFISNKCLYTEDFTPPTQPFNSININVTNKTFSQIDFNISKLGQEVVNKVEVLVNNVVSKTYNNIGDLTYNIDNNLCAIGNNEITIRVTYDDNYVEEEILTHTVTVNKLPTSSSLKDVIDRQELLNSSIEVQKNNLKNILVSKNVEVAEENKLSSLIDKVNELGDAPPPPLYLYKEGDECIDITGGFVTGFITSQGSVEKKPNCLKLKTNSAGNYATLVTNNKISFDNYIKLKCTYKKTSATATIPRFAIGLLNNKTDNILTNSIAFSKNEDKSTTEQTLELDISSVSSAYICVNTTDAVAVEVYKIWLEA